MKQNEAKNYWKRNNAKKCCFNFALVGSQKFEAKRSNKFFLFASACETDLVSLLFALKRKIFFANRRPLGREVNLPGRLKQKSSLKIHRNGTVPGAPEIPEIHIRLHMLFHRKLFVKFYGDSEPAYVVLCRCFK